MADIEKKISGYGMTDAAAKIGNNVVKLEEAIGELDNMLNIAKGNLTDNNIKDAENLIKQFKAILEEMKKTTEEKSQRLKKAGEKAAHVERGL